MGRAASLPNLRAEISKALAVERLEDPGGGTNGITATTFFTSGTTTTAPVVGGVRRLSVRSAFSPFVSSSLIPPLTIIVRGCADQILVIFLSLHYRRFAGTCCR